MSVHTGARAILTILPSVQNRLRQSSLPFWFSLQLPQHPNSSRGEILRQSTNCCYCGTHLKEGLNTTVDHLIPRCLFASDAIANQAGNRLSCCLVCNRLKRDWFPPPAHLSWRSKEDYLRTAKRVVDGRRNMVRASLHHTRPDPFRHPRRTA